MCSDDPVRVGAEKRRPRVGLVSSGLNRVFIATGTGLGSRSTPPRGKQYKRHEPVPPND